MMVKDERKDGFCITVWRFGRCGKNTKMMNKICLVVVLTLSIQKSTIGFRHLSPRCLIRRYSNSNELNFYRKCSTVERTTACSLTINKKQTTNRRDLSEHAKYFPNLAGISITVPFSLIGRALASDTYSVAETATTGINPIQGFVAWMILFTVSAMMHCAEVAITKISPYKVKQIVKKEGPDSPFSTLHQNLTRLLITILLATTACSIYSTALFVASAKSMFPALNLGIITASLTVITLFFGELLPKAVAVSNSEYFARRLLPILNQAAKLFSPLSIIVSFFSDTIFRIMGMHTMTTNSKQKQLNNVSEDMLRMLIHEAQQSKEGIESSEGRMMNAVLDMQDKDVGRIMSPRIDIIGVPESLPVKDLFSTVINTKYSRIPVYKENIDHITGVIFTKDLLDFLRMSDSSGKASIKPSKFHQEKLCDSFGANGKRQISSSDILNSLSKESMIASDIAKPAFFIPETMSCWNALQEMRKRHVHMAIVVDEYGGTSGLVTLEDILEEVIGEIYDEDDSHREILFKKPSNEWTILRKHSTDHDRIMFLMKGYAELDDVCEALQIESLENSFKEISTRGNNTTLTLLQKYKTTKIQPAQVAYNGEYTTLGGLLCSLIGKIPVEGDQVEFANYLFTVVKVEEGRKIIDIVAQPLTNNSNKLMNGVDTSINTAGNTVDSEDICSSPMTGSTKNSDCDIQEPFGSNLNDTWKNAESFPHSRVSFNPLNTNSSVDSFSCNQTYSIIYDQQKGKCLLFRDGEWVDPNDEVLV